MKTNQITIMGLNGGKAAPVNFSTTLGLNIYSNDFKEFTIANTSKLITLQIPISSSISVNFIKYDLNSSRIIQYNLTSNLTSNFTYPFFMNKITVNPDSNPALFVHIKPDNTSIYHNIGYVIWIKYGGQPTLQNYDDVKVFCPEDLITQLNESFYLYFSNSTQSKSFVNYAFRELVKSEFLSYCVYRNHSKNYFKPVITNFVPFTQEFSLRAFTSSCYFYNQTSKKWSNTDLLITSQSTVKYTECSSNHLTDFAGGFIVTPPAIDFNNVWANGNKFLFSFFNI
jgi:hypothetical protein